MSRTISLNKAEKMEVYKNGEFVGTCRYINAEIQLFDCDWDMLTDSEVVELFYDSKKPANKHSQIKFFDYC